MIPRLLITLLLLTASLVNAQTTGSLAYDIYNGTVFEQKNLSPSEGLYLKWQNGLLVNATAGGGTWGSITGTLADQTDLQSALDSKLENGASPTFGGITLTDGTIASGTNTLDYTHIGDQGDVPYIRVNLNDGTDDIGQTIIGFRGDGAGAGTSFVQGSSATFRIEQSGGTLAVLEAANLSGTNTGDVTLSGSPDYITISGQTVTRSLINLASHITGILPFGNGGFGLTNSSASGPALTLGNAEALGTTPTAYLTLRNTTAATSGNQQVSPSLVLEGQGWKTNATAASQTVRFRQNVLPVQGAANPSGILQFQSEINNSGTWVTNATVDSGSTMTTGVYRFATNTGSSFYIRDVGTGTIGVAANGVQIMDLRSGQISIGTNPLTWGSSLVSAQDISFAREASGVLAQRWSFTSQMALLEKTFTSATNRETLATGWRPTPALFLIQPLVGSGGGTAQDVGLARGGSITTGAVITDGTAQIYTTSRGGIAGREAIRTINTNTTATATDRTILIDASAGSITLTLPAVSGLAGFCLNVKTLTTNAGANTVTIDPNASETVDGSSASLTSTTAYTSWQLHCDGTGWFLIK